MPARPDAPLRKVTLNLYEEDCQVLEAYYGHGWSEFARLAIREHVKFINKKRRSPGPRPRTLGDLADD